MKTGAHPFISKLKLFFKWGISFPESSYTIADKGARHVHYISRETLIKGITAVSYTHLDVYKRQGLSYTESCFDRLDGKAVRKEKPPL